MTGPVERALAAARRHGLAGVAAPVAWSGATSDVVAGDDVVVKVAHRRPDAVRALRTDVAVNRFVAGRGVATAAVLVHVEEGLDAYAVLERARGSTLEAVGRRSGGASTSWRDVGRNLAAVHAVPEGSPDAPGGLRVFRQTGATDPRPWLEALLAAGALSPALGRDVGRALDRGAEAVSDAPRTLCHGDVNAANVVARDDDPGRVVLLDWAGAGWLDPVWDLAAVPPAAVPPLLDGHRERQGLPDDGTVADRLVWCRLQLALRRALDDRRPAAVRRVVVEREVVELLDAARGWRRAAGAGC